MIKATDVRVGNLVNDEDNNPVYVAGYWANNEHKYNFRDSAGNTYREGQLHPIPLTREILLKCGFQKDTDETYGIGLPIGNGIDLTIEFDVFGGIETSIINAPNFFYLKSTTQLHQLQNLYFALTQKELEIKL